MEKITKREMFEAIKGLAESGALHMQDFNENISDAAVIEFCVNEIEQLDKKATKAKERAAQKNASNDALTEAVMEALSDEYEPIADITARIQGDDVTIAKVSYRLNQLVKNGDAEKKELTVDGGEGQKKRKIQGYRAIN